MRGICGLSRIQNVGVGTIDRMGVGVEETSRGAPEDTVGRAGHGRQMMQIHAGSGWNGWSAPSGRKHKLGKNQARRELDEQRQTFKLDRSERRDRS